MILYSERVPLVLKVVSRLYVVLGVKVEDGNRLQWLSSRISGRSGGVFCGFS